MIVREFILKIADGTLTKNDIINYAHSVSDRYDLIWSLFFADKEVVSGMNKPLIDFGGIQADRIDRAISYISSEFDISLLDNFITESANSVISLVQYKDLIEYIDSNISYMEMCFVLSKKELPTGLSKIIWRGKAADLIRLGLLFDIKVSELRRLFSIKKRNGGLREIHDNDKPTTEESKLTDIFKKTTC